MRSRSSSPGAGTRRAWPEALLSRPGRIRPEELLRAIREVNPTGRDLAPDETRRRYELKSRLQSRLIREHQDALTIERVGEGDEVVGLRHGAMGQDGCHAVVADLDEDARSWVRLALDTGVAVAPRGAFPGSARGGRRSSNLETPPGEASPDDPLQAGLRALEEFDYERARQHLAQALEESGGGEREAAELLRLLVDRLAAYREALEMEERLSRTALRSLPVRVALATAAAATDRRDDALRFLGDADGPDAAGVHLTLARGALTRGALPEAQRSIDDALRAAPTYPEALALAADLRRTRAAARAPVEDELRRLLASADEAGAAAGARELLERWPDSAVARGVLEELERRRRSSEAARHSADGEAAYARGDTIAAEAAWRKALALGADVAPRIAAAQRLEAGQRAAERVRHVTEAIAAGMGASALKDWLALPDEDRRHVLESTRYRALEVLDQLRSAASAPAEHLAGAALALAEAEAEALDAECDAEKVLEMLEPFARHLEYVEPGRALLARAQAVLSSERSAQIAAALECARNALAGGRWDEAIKAAQRVRGAGTGEAAQEAMALEERARRGQEQESARRTFDELLEKHPFEALRLIPDAGDAGPPEDGGGDPGWQGRRRALAARLRDAARLEVAAGESALPELTGWDFHRQEVAHALHLPTWRLHFARAFGRYLFVYRLDAASGRPEALVSLRTPEPLDCARAVVGLHSLSITGGGGRLLELSLDDWSVLRWESPQRWISRTELVDDALHFPGTRYLWIVVRGIGESDARVRVYDLARGKLHRDFDDACGVVQVAWPGGPRVHVRGLVRAWLCSPSGRLEQSFGGRVSELTPFGAGGALVLVDEEKDDTPIMLRWVEPSGQTQAQAVVPGATTGRACVIGTSTRSGLACSLANDCEGRILASVFSVRGGRLETSYTVPVPWGSHFVADDSATELLLATWSPEGRLAVRQIEEQAPRWPDDMPDDAADEDADIPHLPDRGLCACRDVERALRRALHKIHAAVSEDERSGMMEQLISEYRQDPAALVEAAAMMREWGYPAVGGRASAEASRLHGEHVLVLMGAAEESLENDRPDDALAFLQRAERAVTEPAQRAHLEHLRGLAFYQKHLYRPAADSYTLAADLDGSRCSVRSWAPWLRVLDDEERAFPASTDEPASPSARFLRRILRVDAMLASGSPAEAFRELDVPLIWRHPECQILARMAEAVLRMPALAPVERFRKRLVLAAFLNPFSEGAEVAWTRKRLPLGRATWPEETLKRIEMEAQGWLDGDTPEAAMGEGLAVRQALESPASGAAPCKGS